MNITIKTIQHNRQRYDTCGDWWFDKKGNLQIRISDMGNWKYEALVADHELQEVLLCKARGITQKQVDEFDLNFKGVEPGASKKAPYYKEHKFANKVEYGLCKEFGIDWKKYDKRVLSL